MRKPKLVWKNGDKPTGAYRSFAFRSWPTATVGRDGPIFASLGPETHDRSNIRKSYHPSKAETTVLIVRIADHRGDGTWKWVQLKGRPVGVTAAKALVDTFIRANADYWEAACAAR